MNYYRATNSGVGFILHTDLADYGVRNYYGDVWSCTQNGAAWANRVGATELTAEELQAVNNEIFNNEIKKQIADLEAGQYRATREAVLGLGYTYLANIESAIVALRAQLR